MNYIQTMLAVLFVVSMSKGIKAEIQNNEVTAFICHWLATMSLLWFARISTGRGMNCDLSTPQNKH